MKILPNFQLTVQLYSTTNTSYTVEGLVLSPNGLSVDTSSSVHDDIQFVHEIRNRVHWSCIPKKGFLFHVPASPVAFLVSHGLALGSS